MSDEQESVISKKISEMLEGAFESVALTRRDHFEANPSKRPSKADVNKIITSCANTNFVIAGTANLLPGPLGALAVIPELTLVIRNQIQMIYDLGVAHGREAQLNSRSLLAIFATVSGGGAIGLAAVKGGQLIVKRASLRVIQQVIVWLGGKITQRALKALLAKYVPIVGAAAMAVWARQSTVAMGREAARLMLQDILETDE
jgi:hypothetical protein